MDRTSARDGRCHSDRIRGCAHSVLSFVNRCWQRQGQKAQLLGPHDLLESPMAPGQELRGSRLVPRQQAGGEKQAAGEAYPAVTARKCSGNDLGDPGLLRGGLTLGVGQQRTFPHGVKQAISAR